MSNKQYCVYILTNSRHTVLYTGVTNSVGYQNTKLNKEMRSLKDTMSINWFIMNVVMTFVPPSPAKNKSKQVLDRIRSIL